MELIRRNPVFLFKDKREMGEVFETDFQVDLGWFFLFLIEVVIRQFQSFIGKPFLWRCMEEFSKIPVKGGQAPAGQVT